jgi:hypothetical protein
MTWFARRSLDTRRQNSVKVAITPLMAAKTNARYRYSFEQLQQSSVRVTNMHCGVAPDAGRGLGLYDQFLSYVVRFTTCAAAKCVNRIWC